MQVKSVLANTQAVKLRLSAAERLAKELKPAFIYVLRFEHNKQLADAYLLHLSGGRLAEVLKRLRRESANGTLPRAINRKSLTLTLKDEERIDPTGDALAAAIRRHCPDSMPNYTRSKAAELGTLGFTGVNYALAGTLHASSPEEMVDIFLGLKVRAQATKVTADEVRFNISLPVMASETSLLTIQPNPIDKCVVTFQSRDLQERVSFQCNFYLPALPNIPKELLKARVECEYFQLIIDSARCHLNFDFQKLGKQTLTVWGKLSTLMISLTSKECEILVRGEQQRLDLNLPINGPLLAGDGDYFKTIRTHVEQLNRICWEAGLDEAIRVPFAILEQSGPHILMLSNALDGKNPELTFSGNGRFPSEIEDGHRFGLANTFDLGGVVLAYFCEVDFDVRRDLDSWRFSREGLHK